MARNTYLGLGGYDHWKTTEPDPDPFPDQLAQWEREIAGDDEECPWCGRARYEDCGGSDDYVPYCVIHGLRELGDGDE